MMQQKVFADIEIVQNGRLKTELSAFYKTLITTVFSLNYSHVYPFPKEWLGFLQYAMLSLHVGKIPVVVP